MKKLLLYLFILFGFVFAKDEYFQNRILFCLNKDIPALNIQYKNNQPLTANPGITRLLKKHQIIKLEKWLTSADETDVVGDVKLANIYRAEFPCNKKWAELQNILEDFKIIDDVHSARLEAVVKITAPVQPYVPEDPYYERQWYLEKIMADYAWSLWGSELPGDSTVLVGVVDTGVDYEHPELQSALYINLGEDANGDGVITEADINGTDDDGNGFVDDFRGWDFVGATYSSPQDNDIRPPNAGYYQILSHGTHVSGIIAATANNDIGIAGVSFQSKIIATKQSYDDEESGYLYNAYDGILYCAKMGAKIINCSWGGGGDYGRDVIDDVTENYGAIVVCAAGNDNTNNDYDHHYPSDFENTIAVAAVSSSDKKAYFSNYGDIIDVSAPGMGIYSTIHYNAGAYASWQGTSMASPIVAGSFALLKAWFPAKDRQWLINALLSAADNIDDINPAYSGKLGSGRVNIYNPIACTIYPSLSVKRYSYDILDDNGDGCLNPGESAGINLTIENRAGWLDAENVSALCRSSSPYITFEDSIAEFGCIMHGDTAFNLMDKIIFQVSDQAIYEPVNITVSLSANDTSKYPYRDNREIEIQLSLNQPGFPVMNTSVSLPVAVENLTGDDAKEIIAVGADNYLYVFNSDGSSVNGFPVDLEGYTVMPPIAADVDNDGAKEIVIINRSGLLKIFENDGSVLFEINIDEAVYGNAAVANMDSDPDLEIIFGTMQSNVHIVKIDSTELEGYPLAVSSLIDKGIALADLTGDEIPEMIFGTFDAKLHILKTSGEELENWPLTLDARISQTPVILKSDNCFNIIAAVMNKTLKIIDANGKITGEHAAGEGITSVPSLYDINNDNSVDILFGTADAKLHAVNLTGNSIENFPVQFDYSIRTSPVFADFNNDGNIEIAAGTETGKLYIITNDGNNYPNFPASVDGNLNGSPAVGDIDNDGDIEVVIGGMGGLNVLDVPGEKGSQNIWQTYLGNSRRTGYYQDAVNTSISDGRQLKPVEFELLQNYPNPFNPVTEITFIVPDKTKDSNVTLDIFNILGQKVITLFKGKAKTGVNTVRWHGQNNLGKTTGSGIYIYRLKSADITLTRRMLFIK